MTLNIAIKKIQTKVCNFLIAVDTCTTVMNSFRSRYQSETKFSVSSKNKKKEHAGKLDRVQPFYRSVSTSLLCLEYASTTIFLHLFLRHQR